MAFKQNKMLISSEKTKFKIQIKRQNSKPDGLTDEVSMY